MVSRNSQQRGREPGGSVPRGGGGRGGQGKIIVIPSTTREPKLKTTENAWKPSAKESTSNPEDVQVCLTSDLFAVDLGFLWFTYIS